jgi:hypothetical protein
MFQIPHAILIQDRLSDRKTASSIYNENLKNGHTRENPNALFYFKKYITFIKFYHICYIILN